MHALNRLGFGPRPGEVERVQTMGLEAWIEQQLEPESLDDSAVETKLAGFETLRMSPTELVINYPPPQLLRQMARQLAVRAGMDPEAGASEIAEQLGLRPPPRPARENRPEGSPGDAEGSPAARRERMERLREELARAPQRVAVELSQAKLLRAIHSERQLQEVMVDFWFNHFNVFFGKGSDRLLVTSYEYDAIRPQALGKFRDLLGATARHPAMLFYLDNWMSVDPKADVDPRELRRRYVEDAMAEGVRPGQIYAEILRKHGLDPARYLGPEGEPIGQGLDRPRREPRVYDESAGMRRPGQVGGGGQGRTGRIPRRPQQPPQRQQRRPQQERPLGLNENYARELLELHTLGVDGGYTQQDIIEVARCFTGWTMRPLQLGPKFVFVPELHDRRAKTVLGQKIAAGSGIEDGERVLDMVARHPSTARFVATKLARRFVSDEPPASLVARMAETFRQTDGDIRSVLRTMFNSPEFWSAETHRAKVKTPFEFVVSASRATGAELENFPPGLLLALRELGQPLYFAQPPTGYKDTADAWVSTGALLNRMKVALGMATNQLPGVRVSLADSNTTAPEELIAWTGERVLGQPLSAESQRALTAELEKGLREAGAEGRADGPARLALGWVLASPEFQRR